MNSQEYIEVKIRIEPYSDESAEIVMAEVSDLPFESFTMSDGYLNCYIQKELYNPQMLKVVLSSMDGMAFDLKWSADLIPAKNWNAEWEKEFEPCFVDDKCTIKAPFHKNLPETQYNIVIDPQMAFGTGHHQTTRMMCRGLMNLEVEGKTVVDLGCGTAVLAILAGEMGASKVTGIDIDAVAVVSARENVNLNRMNDKVKIHYGDASRLQRNNNDILLANINRNILVNDMELYAKSLHDDGYLLTSGYYLEDMPIVRKAAEDNGLLYVSHQTDEDWCCTLFKKILK